MLAAVGLCNEFGPQIFAGCAHPMLVSGRSCTCAHCGARCTGRFGGCGEVWARGTQPELAGAAPPVPRTAPPATAPPFPSRPASRPVGGDHERLVVAAVDESGADFSLDSLKVALDGLGREIGRLSRRLDEQGVHQGAGGSEALVNGAVRVVLEELSALTQEIRAERAAPPVPDPEPGVPGLGKSMEARPRPLPDPSPEPPLRPASTGQYPPARAARRNGWGWREYR